MGAGGYVTPVAGAASTGFGEDLIRILITNRVVNLIESGLSVQNVANQAISYLTERVYGRGGVITLGQNGFGVAFNTKRIAFAVMVEHQEIVTGIEPEDLVQLQRLH